MKKIIFFVSIMLFGFGVKASPLIEVNYQDGIYSNRIGDTLYSGQMAFIFMDNEIVYCLDPYKIVGKEYYQDNNYLNNITKEDMEYFELIAYFGYNKTNRNSIYYYMAAQELIWNRIIGEGNTYWTTEKNSGTNIDINSYKREILNDIDNFNLMPSFNDTFWMAPLYEQINIVDVNNVLNNYDMFFSGNSIIDKNIDTLKIKFYDLERQTIQFKRSIKTNNQTIFYSSDGYQTLVNFGINLEIVSQFEIMGYKPSNTKVNINFYDQLTNEKIYNIDFKVCDQFNNEMIDGWVNDNGKYIYNGKFELGEYSICSIPDEYIGDNTFSIEGELKEETSINIYLKKKIMEEKIIEEIPKIKIPDNGLVNNDITLEIGRIEENIGIVNIPNLLEDNRLDNINELDINELPNTCNYNLYKFITLYILFVIGVIIYEKKNIRN